MEIDIKSFNQFMNENDKPRSFGCLMLQFYDNGWKEEIETLIDSDDLYTEEGYGLELEPHCTVLYGFHDDQFDMNECIKNLIPVSDIKISCREVSLFERDQYDVLKYDIISEELTTLNKKFCSIFQYTNDFPEYHAHCTIAYLKPGTGKKYVSEVEKNFIPKEYKYSYGSGDNVFIRKAIQI